MQAMFRNIPSGELMYPKGEEPDSEFLRAYHIFRVKQNFLSSNMIKLLRQQKTIHVHTLSGKRTGTVEQPQCR